MHLRVRIQAVTSIRALGIKNFSKSVCVYKQDVYIPLDLHAPLNLRIRQLDEVFGDTRKSQFVGNLPISIKDRIHYLCRDFPCVGQQDKRSAGCDCSGLWVFEVIGLCQQNMICQIRILHLNGVFTIGSKGIERFGFIDRIESVCSQLLCCAALLRLLQPIPEKWVIFFGNLQDTLQIIFLLRSLLYLKGQRCIAALFAANFYSDQIRQRLGI